MRKENKNKEDANDENKTIQDESTLGADQNPKEDEVLTAEEPKDIPKPEKPKKEDLAILKVEKIKQPYNQELMREIKMLKAVLRFVIGTMTPDTQNTVHAAFPELKED